MVSGALPARRTAGLAKGLGPISGLLPRDHLTEESAIQVDLSKEIGAPAALPGHRVQGHAERGEGLVRPARRLGPGNRARPGRQLRAQARQPRDRRPGGRADGDARVADPRPEQVRAGGRRLPGCAGLQPDPDREPGPTGFPLANFQPGAVAGPGYSPFIRIAGSDDRLQRADRRHRRRAVRRRPPHEHRRPRARRPHRRPRSPGPVRGVLGRPAVREGLRRRPADRLHLDRRRPAADLRARALDVRSRARQGALQRRRRLPRLRPRAPVRIHQRPDRRRTTRSRRASSTCQGRPRLRGRERRQHRR